MRIYKYAMELDQEFIDGGRSLFFRWYALIKGMKDAMASISWQECHDLADDEEDGGYDP